MSRHRPRPSPPAPAAARVRKNAEKHNPLYSLYPGVSGTFCKRAKENIALLLVCLRCRGRTDLRGDNNNLQTYTKSINLSTSIWG